MPWSARRALLTVILVAAVHGTALADAPFVIPPGQDLLVGQLLGGTLPGDCKLEGASLSRTFVAAELSCGGGGANSSALRLELHHPGDLPSDGPGTLITTDKFAVLVRAGSPPPGFAQALESQLRGKEGAWQWLAPRRDLVEHVPGKDSSTHPVRAHEAALVVAAVAMAAGFGAFLLLVNVLARRPGVLARLDDNGARLGAWGVLQAIAIAVGAYGLLVTAVGPPPLHSDTLRDLWMALDCVRGRACNQGAPSSFFALEQGALWVRFLAASRRSGLGIAATQHAIFALQALATTLVFVLARRLWRPLGLPSALCFAALATHVAGQPQLWNPSLAPLPVALFYLAWRRLVAHGGLAEAAVCGVALALSVEAHLVGVLLVPLFGVALAGAARRPVIAFVVGVGASAATLFAISSRTWIDNLRSLPSLGGLAWAGAVGLLVLMVLAFSARSRLVLLDEKTRARVWFVGAAALAPALAWLGFGKVGGMQYLTPFTVLAALVPVALFFAIAWPLRRVSATVPWVIATIAAAGSTAWQAKHIHGGFVSEGWRLPEIERLAQQLYATGIPYRDLKPRVRSPSPFLSRSLLAFEPLPRPAGHAGGEDLLVLRVPRSALPNPLPSSWQLVDLDGGNVAVIRPIASSIQSANRTVCRQPVSGNGATQESDGRPDCVSVLEEHKNPEDLHPEGGQPEPYEPCPVFAGEMAFPYRATWEFLITPPPAPGRALRLVGDSGWSLGEIQGKGARADGKSGVIVEPAGNEPVRVMVSRTFSDGMDWMKGCAPPTLAETATDEAALRSLLASPSVY